MKKILIFSLTYYPRFIGGAEVAIKEITDRIPNNEIQFDMITLRKHASSFERIGNVNVYRVGFPWFKKSNQSSKIFPLSKLLFPFFAVIKAISLNRKNKYDLTWSMMASYAGFAGYLFKIFKPNIPNILSIQEGDNFEKRQGLFNFFFKKIFINANKVQVISNFLEKWSKDMGTKCPIVLVPNGVDIELFSRHQSIEKENSLKKELNKKENDYFLITTSRLVEKNAVIDIINSLQYLSKNIKLLIIGTGYQFNILKEKVDLLGLNERVKFLGFIEHKDMPKYLHISDIFIRPSLTEGFGNSFIEAMAANLPVIATPVGGIIDFLEDGKTGLFCEIRNPKSIAQKVEKLIKDKESRDYIIKNSSNIVRERYHWDLIARDMKNKVFLS